MKKLFIILLILPFLAVAQKKVKKPQKTRILFVLDGSQSMIAQWESGTKMVVAQRILSEMVDSLKNFDHIEMALRVYGHQKPVPPQDCNDTKLEVPFSKNNASKIKNRLFAIRPKGTTPIARSLELSANDFPKNEKCRNIIILITDGIESCDGDPCAVSLALQKQGIILKPFIIGIGLDDQFKETFDCVGRYYDANDETRFKEVLNVVVSQALNTTTAQVNLLDSNNDNTETDVNMSFYDTFSGELLYNFIHTMNKKGNPDTLRIDPVPIYRIQVHTIPPVTANNIEIIPAKHNTINIKTPQGALMVKMSKSIYNKKLQFIVRKNNNKETLNVQSINTIEKYITGTYNIEILTIPRIIINDVKIKQSVTEVIQIQKPGLITFESSAPSFGALYKKDGNNLVWIMNLNPSVTNQTYSIQPGNYQVISRPKNAIENVFTSNKKFTVQSGVAEKIILF